MKFVASVIAKALFVIITSVQPTWRKITCVHMFAEGECSPERSNSSSSGACALFLLQRLLKQFEFIFLPFLAGATLNGSEKTFRDRSTRLN